MRFRDYDGMARLALVGSAAAAVSFLLPWVSFRLALQPIDLSGTSLVVLPAVLQRIGAPAGAVAFGVAGLAAIALVAGLASLLLALDPGLRVGSVLAPRAGFRLAVAGAVTGALALLLMLFVVGPTVGPGTVGYGGALGLLGFVLAAAAWPRAKLLDDDGGHHPPPPAASHP